MTECNADPIGFSSLGREHREHVVADFAGRATPRTPAGCCCASRTGGRGWHRHGRM
jgi:hypothetical protein